MTRARQAAEALFTVKPVIEPSIASVAPADQSVRKPRVLQAMVPDRRNELGNAAVAAEPRATHAIPRADVARIRIWVKYGMTTREVAQVYRITVDEVERALRGA
jgi:hypothetical protein